MKTNTFIFNFINPSRLVLKNLPAQPAETGSPVVERKKEALQKHEQTVKKAEEEYQKAWDKELEAIDKLAKARQEGKSEDIAKNVQLAADASVKRQEAGSAFAELRASELKDPWAEKKVVFTEDALETGGFSKKNPYEDEPEIIKANPKTKKAIEALLKNPSDTLKNFLTADHTGKNWKELNKEFLAVLGITGGSERSHIKALQEVLFGKNEKDERATDGRLGKYTLAKLQNRIPQQNLEGVNYNDRLIVFLNKRVDFSQVPAENLAKLTDKNTTAEQKIAILKAEMARQRNMSNEQVNSMLALAVGTETGQKVATYYRNPVTKEEFSYANEEDVPEGWVKVEGEKETTMVAEKDEWEKIQEKEERIAAAERNYKAEELYKNGQYPEALAEFEAVYEVRPLPSILYNIAASKLAMKDYHGAMVAYEKFLKNPRGVDDKTIKDFEEKLARFRSTQEETAIAYAERTPGAYWNPKTGEAKSFTDVSGIPEDWVPVEESRETQIASATPAEKKKKQV